MIDATWLIPIGFGILIMVFGFWSKWAWMKIEIDFLKGKCEIEEMYSRNLVQILEGESTEEYPDQHKEASHDNA